MTSVMGIARAGLAGVCVLLPVRGQGRDAARDPEFLKKAAYQWMVDPKNGRFAVIIVHRMWERVMGTPIFDPVDEDVEPDQTVTPRWRSTCA